MPAEHQFVQLGHGLGVLSYLFLCGRVQDGEAGVDVPFVGVDSESYVDLDVFDAADVA